MIALKRISFWGKNNPWTARILLVVLHTALVLLALLGGFSSSILFGMDLAGLGPWVIGLFLLIVLGYPIQNSIFTWYQADYKKRKIFDASLIIACFSIFFILGNQAEQIIVNPTAIEQGEVMSIQSVVGQNSQRSKFNFNQLKERFAEKRMALKKEFKNLKTEFKAKAFNFHHFAWLLLILGISVLLALAIAGIACNLSCSGMEAAAGIVFFGGVFLLIAFLIFSIRKVLKSEKLKAKGRKKKDQTS